MDQPVSTLFVEPPATSSPPSQEHEAREGFTRIDGERFYCIPGFDALDPFLMTLANDGDLWMYVSSAGGLTAGRRCAEQCLFPYETDDRLHRAGGVTGPVTLLRAEDGALWEPFAGVADPSQIRRSLYKNVTGTRILFEETHLGLDLTFRYTWQACDEFGFVRSSTLVNRSPDEGRRVEILDGLLNVMPAGIPLRTQQASSCLADAYKTCEVDGESRLGIFSLSSLISDRPAPAESLRANVVWCRGLETYRIGLSERQVRNFRLGRGVTGESRLRGQRGCFLVSARVELKPGRAMHWDLVADVHRTQTEVGRLRRFLLEEPSPMFVVRECMRQAEKRLRRIVASADGLQQSADPMTDTHHFTNVLFNVMRGGYFVDQGWVGTRDFLAFVETRNRPVAQRQRSFLESLPGRMRRADLAAKLDAHADADLIRLGLEYLPLTFGRRHGDPSRPWNHFNIAVRQPDGSVALHYEGNWRDIFQNWESLCLSHPDYLEHVIAKFVNASTIDGFNPYRITRDGIDWETPDPHDPWSNIGYWGDHQLVYLLRLLEASKRSNPGRLRAMLRRPVFSYANVPYRIRPYEQLLRNCRATIDFDTTLAQQIQARLPEIGTDARLLASPTGGVYHVPLVEKLLVSLLGKVSNLVPEGGIWLNTQRPEWNDANNALAGFGLSVVTLCYLRRTLKFVADLLGETDEPTWSLTAEVHDWLERITGALQAHAACLDGGAISDVDRKRILDALGAAFSAYRTRVYQHGFSGRREVDRDQILAFLGIAIRFVDHSIRANRRKDGMYHAYNLLQPSKDGHAVAIERLPEMLEGQVAVLSAGLLDGGEALGVIEAMFSSPLYDPGRRSFLLYPDRPTTGFLQKNRCAASEVRRIGLLSAMSDAGDDRIVIPDDGEVFRFNADFRNHDDLAAALDRLAAEPRFAAMVARDRTAVMDLYERVFGHHAFTGRSCSMAGYEGLGCIYWHMVAKLLVAVQETFRAAVDAQEPPQVRQRLASAYYRIRSGLGFKKSAREYGAFPADPYSHTPSHSGARQPGMTGQVKEEIITRLGELGVLVRDGALAFEPQLLTSEELTTSPELFNHVGVDGQEHSVQVPPHGIAFTLCQVPVVYRFDGIGPRIIVRRAEHRHDVIPGSTLDRETTAALFARTGEVTAIEVAFPCLESPQPL